MELLASPATTFWIIIERVHNQRRIPPSVYLWLLHSICFVDISFKADGVTIVGAHTDVGFAVVIDFNLIVIGVFFCPDYHVYLVDMFLVMDVLIAQDWLLEVQSYRGIDHWCPMNLSEVWQITSERVVPQLQIEV